MFSESDGNYAPILPGSELPDFSLPTLDGRDIRLADYRGVRLILFVWASWLACRDPLPGWQQFYKEKYNDSFELMSVGIDVQGADRLLHYIVES